MTASELRLRAIAGRTAELVVADLLSSDEAFDFSKAPNIILEAIREYATAELEELRLKIDPMPIALQDGSENRTRAKALNYIEERITALSETPAVQQVAEGAPVLGMCTHCSKVPATEIHHSGNVRLCPTCAALRKGEDWGLPPGLAQEGENCERFQGEPT